MKKRFIAGLIAVSVAVTSCSRGEDEELGHGLGEQGPTEVETTQPPLPGSFADVDQSSVDAVGKAVLTEFFSWRPIEDRSPADAANRSKSLMDEEYYARTSNSWSAMTAVPGKKWDGWKAHNASLEKVTVTESKEQRPPDEEMKAFRQYRVEITLSVDGQPQKISYDAFATFTKLGWWRLADMHLTQPQFS